MQTYESSTVLDVLLTLSVIAGVMLPLVMLMGLWKTRLANTSIAMQYATRWRTGAAVHQHILQQLTREAQEILVRPARLKNVGS